MSTSLSESFVNILANPKTHAPLVYKAGNLSDSVTAQGFSVVNGIPVLLDQQDITGLNLKYQRMYDRMARGYDFVENFTSRFFERGLPQVRRAIADSVPVRDGSSLLEVSVGTGVNIHNIQADAHFYGLDISMGMLSKCQRNMAKWNRHIDLVQGNAEALPFLDESFDAVLHFGGINFFNDKACAVQEMIRVAKPGATIVIGDETEKQTQDLKGLSILYEKSNSALYAPPRLLVPKEMKDVKIETIWNDRLYLLSFIKP